MIVEKAALEVAIGGKRVRPSVFRVEQYERALPRCDLVLSGELRGNFELGTLLEATLEGERIFTGSLLSVGATRGGDRLKAGYKLDPSSVNFRKEKAIYIFEALVVRSGLARWQANLPNIELSHFHANGEGWENLLAFVVTLEGFVDDNFDIYFGADGILNLKALQYTGSPRAEFYRGKNALLAGDETLKAFPEPVGYGDFVGLEGEIRRIRGLRYLVSPKDSLMELQF